MSAMQAYHQYGTSVHIPQTLFHEETSGSIAKC